MKNIFKHFADLFKVLNTKYILTDEFIIHKWKKLYRIQANENLWYWGWNASRKVNKWDFWWYIESDKNLSWFWDSWVYDNAKVYGSANVYGDVAVTDNAEIYGNALVWWKLRVSGDAKIYWNAHVYRNDEYNKIWIYNNAEIYWNAKIIWGCIRWYAKVYWNAVIKNSVLLEDYVKVYWDAEIEWFYHLTIWWTIDIYWDARIEWRHNHWQKITGDYKICWNTKIDNMNLHKYTRVRR